MVGIPDGFIYLHKKTLTMRAILLILVCTAALFSAEGAEPSDDYEKALKRFQAKDYEASYIHVRNSLKTQPDYLPAKILMGRLFLRNGLFEEAESEFFEAMMAGADPELVTVFWAESLLKQQKYAQIIAYSPPSESLSPDTLKRWLIVKASACELNDDAGCARTSYKQLQTNPEYYIDGLLGLAGVSLMESNVDATTRYLDEAQMLAPENPETWRLKGLMAKQIGALDVSIRHLEKALELAPNDPAIARNLADAFLAVHDFDAAKILVSEILNSAPEDPYVLLVSGWLDPKPDALRRDLKKVNEILADIPDEGFQDQPYLYYLLGLAAYLEGRFEQAKEAFTGFWLKYPEDFQASLLLAKTNIALDDVRGAVKLLESHKAQLIEQVSDAIVLGELFIRAGQNHKAYAWVSELKTAYPDNVGVNLLDAKLMIARGKVTQGLEALEGLVQAFPDAPVILKTHATVSLQMGRFDKASDSIIRLKSLLPDDLFVDNLVAALRIMQGRFDEAQTLLADILTHQPDMFAAQFNQAVLLSKTSDLTKAAEAVRILLEAQPGHIASHLLSADIRLAQGDLDAAWEGYKVVSELDGNNLKAREGIVEILIRKNDFASATQKLKPLLRGQPDNLKYKLDHIRILIGQNKTRDANNELETLFALAQQQPVMLIAINRLQLVLGDNAAALKSIQRAHTLIPAHLPTHIRYIKGLIGVKQFKVAQAELDELGRQHPDSLEIWFTRAELAEVEGDVERAGHLYRKILSVDERFDLALAKLFSLASKGIAVADYLKLNQHIVEAHPKAYFPRSLLAQYAYYTGDTATAIKHYQYLDTHVEVPDEAALLNRLALLHMPSDLEVSEAYSERAYALSNSKSSVADTYGWILAQTGRLDEALPMLRRAQSLNASSPLIRYHLAYVLHGLGKSEEARQQLHVALKEHPVFYDREQAVDLLKRLDDMSATKR